MSAHISCYLTIPNPRAYHSREPLTRAAETFAKTISKRFLAASQASTASLLGFRVPLLACPAVRSGYPASTAGQASSGTQLEG